MAPTQLQEVEQYGITFQFSAPQTVGQFANGDYWIVGPITLTGTLPAFDGTHNGFEINPDSYNENGFDNRLSGWNAERVPQLCD